MHQPQSIHDSFNIRTHECHRSGIIQCCETDVSSFAIYFSDERASDDGDETVISMRVKGC